jgi:hypothetical protein
MEHDGHTTQLVRISAAPAVAVMPGGMLGILLHLILLALVGLLLFR